jgi:hypothetical protein
MNYTINHSTKVPSDETNGKASATGCRQRPMFDETIFRVAVYWFWPPRLGLNKYAVTLKMETAMLVES